MIRLPCAMVAAFMLFAAPASAQTFSSVTFSADKLSRSISDDDVRITLAARQDAELDSLITVSAAIRIPGFAPFTLDEGDPANIAFARQIAIGKLAKADAAPSVLFQTFTGGAHCCAQLWAVVPMGGKLETVKFGLLDGDGIDAFPVDIDGDDVVDFILKDDRFNYAFSSYAGSFAPPQIFNVIQGKLVDVSARESFAGTFEQTADEARALCADTENSDRNGACATYVAASARVGKFDTAIRHASALAAKGGEIFLPTACTVPLVDGSCPDDKEKSFPDFESALRWFLRDAGYIR
ncbi:MAG: hypothetical protein V4808_14430 [Pseudomonadota bacterium]